MLKLVPPDSFHVSAAIGWIELGNAIEAKAELEKVSPELRKHPGVLEVEWTAEATAKNWPAALKIAQQIIKFAPDEVSGWLHQAYALRRVPQGGLLAAWNALFAVAEKFPDEGTVFYNLACYACQMEQMESARQLLQRAIKIDGEKHIKELALNDSDLEPMWDEIREM